MKTADFDYELPPEYIAQTPVEPRDASRLMVVHRDRAQIEHRHFRDIVDYLQPGDLLVANESRVIPARLYGYKIPTRGKIELLLLNKRSARTWEVLLKGRRVRLGTEFQIVNSASQLEDKDTLKPQRFAALPRGELLERTDAGGWVVEFSAPIEPLLNRVGEMPLPPYIHEPLRDAERYQTVYSRVQGSAAAPTAGLHFTPELIERLQQREINFAFVTLHVGLDTFRPVKEENITEHQMHSEYCEISGETAQLLNTTRAAGCRIVAVGTTTVRVLESAAQEQSRGSGSLRAYRGWTDIFIYPGYRFRAMDALITNFHLPRSTLIMLVSAFAGRELCLRAYEEAKSEGYRFYSFGDAMLLL